MMSDAVQCVFYLAVLVAVGIPLGVLMARVMDGERTFLSPLVRPVERGVYRLLRIDEAEQMGWKRYLASVLAFSGIGLVLLTVLQMVQQLLPLNPQAVLPDAVPGPHGAELRIGCNRHRRDVCPHSRLSPGKG